jgi:phenylpropionate dioxygenase-like ring-hydroxylating dioxygenase large terminal subunit
MAKRAVYALDSDFETGSFKFFGDTAILRSATGFTAGSRYCPHRGVSFREDCLTCPFHGQRWKPDRELSVVGSFVCEAGVVQGSRLLALSESLGPCFGSEMHTVPCDYRLWLANTADPRHLPHVHKDSFNPHFRGQPFDVVIEPGYSSYKIAIRDESLCELSKYANIESSFFTHELFYPYLSVTSFAGVFYSLEWAYPLSQTACTVHTRFFTHKAASLPSALTRTALRANKRVLSEDRQICTAWQDGLNQTRMAMSGENRIDSYLCETGFYGAKMEPLGRAL